MFKKKLKALGGGGGGVLISIGAPAK